MFVSASDLHLREDMLASLPGVRGDAYESYRQIIQHCIDVGASALVLAGDVFDRQPSSRDVSVFLDGVLKLRDENIKVYAIQGQHGYDNLSWTSIHPYVIDLNLASEPQQIEPGVFVTGFDIQTPDELQKKLKKLKKTTNVLVLHQMAKGCIPDIAGVSNWDYDPEWTPAYVQLVLLGDYHNQWETFTNEGKTRHIYHGSTYLRAVNERVDKRFFEVSFVDGKFQVTFVPLQTRPFHEFTVKKAEDVDATFERLAACTAESLVLMSYDPEARDKFEHTCREKFPALHFYFKRISQELLNPEVYDVDKLREISLQGCLDQLVNREADAKFHGFMLSLLGAENAQEVLNTYRTKFLEDATVT
jgi:DNA repair exonuclease SbcCD nuclease subunit